MANGQLPAVASGGQWWQVVVSGGPIGPHVVLPGAFLAISPCAIWSWLSGDEELPQTATEEARPLEASNSGPPLQEYGESPQTRIIAIATEEPRPPDASNSGPPFQECLVKAFTRLLESNFEVTKRKI